MDMQIVWKANFLDSTGYSCAARGYLLGLVSLGANVRAENIELKFPRVDLPADQESIIHECFNRTLEKEFIYVRHFTPDGFRHKKKAAANVGVCAWESSHIHPFWGAKCNEMDAIWLPSRHNIKAFRQSGVTVPLHYVRHGINVVSAESPKVNLANQDMPEFKFLSVFQWNYRKGYDTLLKAYWQEFMPEDDVCLVIKTYGMNISIREETEILNEIARMKKRLGFRHTAPIYLYARLLSTAQMEALYRLCDCFVLPTRGEGVGLPFLESAAFALPVIATGWGGQTDFLAPENSWLIDYELVPPSHMIENNFRYWDHQHLWAEPDVNHLRSLMRYVFTHREEAAKKGKKLRKDVAAGFTWQDAARDVDKAVYELTGRRLF